MRLVLVGGGAKRSKAALGVGDARPDREVSLWLSRNSAFCALTWASSAVSAATRSSSVIMGVSRAASRSNSLAETQWMPTPHNITPALAASARPTATRKGAAVPRYGKASGVIADLPMYRSPAFERRHYDPLQLTTLLIARVSLKYSWPRIAAALG